MSIPENNAGAAVPHTITHAAIQHPIALPAAVVHPAAAVPAAALAPGTMLTKPLFSAPLLSAAQAAHLALPPAQPPASALVSRMNLRRIPATIDPIGVAAQGHEPALQPFRLAAAAKIFGGLQRMQQHVGAAMQVLQQPKLPPKLVGALHQPDGTAAARVQVQFQPASVGLKGAAETVLTADDGGFTLNIPIGATLPPDGLPLTIHGATANLPVVVPPDQIAANGMIGVVTLSSYLAPLPVSILTALRALVPAGAARPIAPVLPPQQKHSVTIGEAGSTCVQSFAASQTTDRFPWGLFFRIVEPQMSIATQALEFPLMENKFMWMPIFATEPKLNNPVQSKFVDRVPVDQPLSVDGFRDQIAGIDPFGQFTENETVPMAASLGLGYVLRMAQQWNFQGLGLGDLVYSLPLAPGEQQQVAVFERKDTSSVQESEFFSQSEAMDQSALSDTSTTAVFNSAFSEIINGSSSFYNKSDSSSSGASGGVGFGIGPIAIGGGASTSSGNSTSTGNASSSLSGSRDATSQATQATHSSSETHASARVSANRTGMRLATASESMDVTTKTITNHNHAHALTMQYWQVLRMYDVTTSIEGLTLVCLVPMQVVRFMPPGQAASLNDPSIVDSQPKVLARYANILRHIDILRTVVPREFQHGLNLLAQFAADPTTGVEAAGGSAETVIAFKLTGTFLSCESVSVRAVTKRNTRVGPVRLGPATASQPAPIPPDTFMTQDELVSWLTFQRQNATVMLQGSLALPPSINRSDIIGFEISRQYATVRYTLTSAAKKAAELLISQQAHSIDGSTISNLSNSAAGQALNTPTITLNAGELEPLLGGPTLDSFSAAVEDFNKKGTDVPSPQETYANENLGGIVLPPQPFPVPALQLAPLLRYQDVLEIEKAAQHVIRNTTRYSKALWMSMTPEESAILLDGYTIGVPPDGLADSSQMIPLLNCVQNVILGTFGNSLIMPFNIPPDVAEEVGLVDPGMFQDALLAYHREAFVPPHSTVALPTRGVLGEAVLGHCPSAEKIDLTRFWNWQDAPADTAPGIGMVQLPTTTPPLTTGVAAPNSLTNLPPLINNLITAPQPNTGLLQAMGQQAASQQDFSSALTGQQQLASIMQNGQTVANQARADALKTSQTMGSDALKAMTTLVTTAMNVAAGGGASAQKPGSTPSTKSGDTSGTSGAKSGTSGAKSGTGGAQQAGATQTADASAPVDSSTLSTVAQLAPLAALAL